MENIIMFHLFSILQEDNQIFLYSKVLNFKNFKILFYFPGFLLILMLNFLYLTIFSEF